MSDPATSWSNQQQRLHREEQERNARKLPTSPQARIDRLDIIEPWLKANSWELESNTSHFRTWLYRLRGYPTQSDVKLRFKCGANLRDGFWNELALYKNDALPVLLRPGNGKGPIVAIVEAFAFIAEAEIASKAGEIDDSAPDTL